MQAAVLGVGDSAWHLTYQAVPTEMDTLLRQSLGLSPRPDGERVLSQSTLSVSRAHHASLDTIDEGVSNGYVASIRELRRTSEDATAGRPTRHVEITRPEGMTYETGDHLIVHSYNLRLIVDRALDVLGIEAGAMIEITAEDSADTWLPTGVPVDARFLFGGFDAQVFDRRLTLLDLLTELGKPATPLEVTLSLLSPLKRRRYSISSSPHDEPEIASTPVGVVRRPALSGHGTFRGVSSTYLAGVEPGK